MHKILILLASITMSWAASANPAPATVDGVTLNIGLDEVKSLLGEPLSESLTEPNPCNDDAPDMELAYEGLDIVLSQTPTAGYSVTSIDVTGNRALAGIRIGDDADKVRLAFGDAELGADVLSYDFGQRGDGQTYEFTIKNGKVSHIKLNSYMC